MRFLGTGGRASIAATLDIAKMYVAPKERRSSGTNGRELAEIDKVWEGGVVTDASGEWVPACDRLERRWTT